MKSSTNLFSVAQVLIAAIIMIAGVFAILTQNPAVTNMTPLMTLIVGFYFGVAVPNPNIVAGASASVPGGGGGGVLDRLGTGILAANSKVITSLSPVMAMMFRQPRPVPGGGGGGGGVGVGKLLAMMALIDDPDPDGDPEPDSKPGGGGGGAGPVPPTTTYIVVAGDTLIALADVYGIPVDQLIALNPTVNPNVPLYIGQVLNVPEGSPKAAPDPATSDGKLTLLWDGYRELHKGYCLMRNELYARGLITYRPDPPVPNDTVVG